MFSSDFLVMYLIFGLKKVVMNQIFRYMGVILGFIFLLMQVGLSVNNGVVLVFSRSLVLINISIYF